MIPHNRKPMLAGATGNIYFLYSEGGWGKGSIVQQLLQHVILPFCHAFNSKRIPKPLTNDPTLTMHQTSPNGGLDPMLPSTSEVQPPLGWRIAISWGKANTQQGPQVLTPSATDSLLNPQSRQGLVFKGRGPHTISAQN